MLTRFSDAIGALNVVITFDYHNKYQPTPNNFLLKVKRTNLCVILA